MADREIEAGIDRLAAVKLAPHEALDAMPELKPVSADNRYMRDEPTNHAWSVLP
jgi:hypothetical protein